jgi:formyl-CoA transferase
MGLGALIAEPAYATPELRSANRDALNAALQARFRDLDTAQWIATLNAAGVPCGPIYRIDEMFADPQIRHLGVAQKVADSDLSLMGQPVALSRSPSRIARASPPRGGHTDEILAEFGLDADEIAALRSAGTI